MLRLLFRLLAVALFVAPFVLLFLAIEREPLVQENEEARFDDIAGARDILKRFDPRHMDPARRTTVSVSDREISMAVGAALARMKLLRGRVQAAGDGVIVQGTAELPLPDTYLGRYLNIEAVIASSDRELVVSELSVGALEIPAWAVKPAAIFVLDWLIGPGKGAPAYAAVRSLSVDGPMITVALQPPSGLVGDVKSAAGRLFDFDREPLRAYYANLIDTGRTGAGTLTPYLRNAFALARTRSETRDATAENRALILALALHFGDHRFGRLLDGVETPELKAAGMSSSGVTIHRRRDWVQHLTTSAGLAVASNAGISDLIGVAKEVRDSLGSSGFSFGDLAADRTGVRLAEVATASDASARRVQAAFARVAGEDDYFPQARDLPEDLSDAEFRARFGDVDSPAYLAEVDKIDRRIARLEIYR